VYRFGLLTFVLAIVSTAVIWRFGYPLDVLQSWLIAINLITLLTYLYDKIIAGSNWTRVPEKVLLALTFAGGTGGALVGRWLFCHKTAKLSFRLKFWLVVAAQIIIVILYHAVIKPWIG